MQRMAQRMLVAANGAVRGWGVGGSAPRGSPVKEQMCGDGALAHQLL